MDAITNSQLTCAATCLRKHQWRYTAGIRPATESIPLRFGTSIHKCLELIWQGKDVNDVLLSISGIYDGVAETEYEKETVCVYANLYAWRYADFIANCKTIATELEFNVPIVNPETGRSARISSFAGKIDAIIQLPDGRLAVLEHKTTISDISPESNYWKRLRVDTQIARYVIAARYLGYQIDTVWYDVLCKPAIRPGSVPLTDDTGTKIVLDVNGERVRTKDGKKWRETGSSADGYVLQTRPETPDEWKSRLHETIVGDIDRYFAQREIPRTEAELNEARADLWDHAQVLHQCETESRYPRNSSACIGFGACEYLDLCSVNLSPNDSEVPAGFYKTEQTHTELESAA